MQRDVLNVLWHLLSSRRLTLVLLTALALSVLLSAIFPQMPTSMGIGSGQYGHWYREIRARYLQWTDPLEFLGLFSLFSSPWFKVPLALLALNLTICAIEQFEAARRWPPTSQRFDEAVRQASQAGNLVTSGDVRTKVRGLKAILEARRYKVDVEEREDSSHLIAQRYSVARWAALLAHGGLSVVIVGVLVGGRLAWREEEISLSPGQVYQIQHVPSLSLRADNFQVQLYPDGAPRYYRAELTVLEQGEEVKSGTTDPNAPFTYGGMSFHQVSHGPAIRIKGTDSQGEPVSLQALVRGGELGSEATLQLSEQQNEGYVAAPQRNLIFRLLYGKYPRMDGGESPGLLLQVYRGGVTELVFSDTVFSSTFFQIEGSSYSVDWSHYGVLTIVRDPSFAPLMAGGVVLVAAMVISLYLPPRCIWAVLSGTGDLVEMRLVDLGAEGMSGTAEFEALVQQVEESL